MESDIGSFTCLVDPDILCTRSLATDEDMDMSTEVCEIERLGDSSIPTPDDSYDESLIEVPITGRAVGYSLSIEIHLASYAKFFVLVSCGEDDPLRFICISFLSFELESILANLRHDFDTILYDCRSRFFCLYTETLHDLSSWS